MLSINFGQFGKNLTFEFTTSNKSCIELLSCYFVANINNVLMFLNHIMLEEIYLYLIL